MDLKRNKKRRSELMERQKEAPSSRFQTDGRIASFPRQTFNQINQFLVLV